MGHIENKEQNDISKSLLVVIALNVNGLNVPIKRQRLAEWIKAHDPTMCCLQVTHLRSRDTKR